MGCPNTGYGALSRLTLLTTHLGRQALAQVTDTVPNVGESLFLIAYLPLKAQGAAVADSLQRLDELANVDLALTERHLITPGARYCWPLGVFDMDGADMRRQNLDSPQRVAFVVEEHVGRVEVDLQVRAL